MEIKSLFWIMLQEIRGELIMPACRLYSVPTWLYKEIVITFINQRP